MKWLFVICGADEESGRKQKRQWEIVCSGLMGKPVSMEAIAYREAAPAAIARDIMELDQRETYDGILVAAGNYTEDIAGKYAALKGSRCLLSVSDITWDCDRVFFHKSVYQSNMEAAFCLQPPFIAGLAPWKERKCAVCSGMEISERILPLNVKGAAEKTLIKAGDRQKESDVLLAVGKGVRTRAEVQKFKEFAVNKGYMFGVTRPVAMNGWAGIEEIIGVSGHIYSPKICITIGVSGSAAFYAGIENSGWIASVNTDDHAPIINMSDVSVIDDYENVWERLSQLF